MGYLSAITISKLIFPKLVQAFYLRATYNIGDPIIFIVRGVEICLDRITSIVSLILLWLDLEYTSPRCGPLCHVLSLERLFRVFVGFQMPTGLANPEHTT